MRRRRCCMLPSARDSRRRAAAGWGFAIRVTARSCRAACATCAPALRSTSRGRACRSASARRPATSSFHFEEFMMNIDIENFGRELDELQAATKASLGAADRRYIQRVIRTQRAMALGGRVMIFASLPLMPLPPLFFGAIGAGAVSLGLSKILENMEIGHNVIHGQWDWMNDPDIHSSTWEWDNVCPADQWKHSH